MSLLMKISFFPSIPVPLLGRLHSGHLKLQKMKIFWRNNKTVCSHWVESWSWHVALHPEPSPQEQTNNICELDKKPQIVAYCHAVAGDPTNPLGLQQYDKNYICSTKTLSWTARNSKRTKVATTPRSEVNIASQEKNYQTLITIESDIHTKVYDMKNIMHTNQTGSFPIRSSQGTRYLMISYEIAVNAILVAPVKTKHLGKWAGPKKIHQMPKLRLKKENILYNHWK